MPLITLQAPKMDWMEASTNNFVDVAFSTLTDMEQTLNIIFAICFPLLLLSYLILRPLEKSVKDEVNILIEKGIICIE